MWKTDQQVTWHIQKSVMLKLLLISLYLPLALKSIFADRPAGNNNDSHLWSGEKYSFIGTVITKCLLSYNFIWYSLSEQNWFEEIRERKTTKAGHSLLLWGIVTIFGSWCALVEKRTHRIQHGGQSPTYWKGEFIFLLNKTITTLWAKVKFSLSFLTERFNFQPQKYLKNNWWKFSLWICCLYIVERYAKFTAYIILIWTRLWIIIVTYPLGSI